MTKAVRPEEQLHSFPLSHYSYSSLVRFATNPILFKIRDINGDRIDTTTNISAVIGQAFHKGMEVYYRGNPDMLPRDDTEALEMSLQVAMDFLENYPEGFIEYSKSVVDRQKARDMLSFAVTSYIKERPHRQDEELLGTELEVREAVDVEYRGHTLDLPVPLKGYIDKVCRQDGKLKITDYKTCRAFSDPEKIDGGKIIQAVQYYFLVYAHFGEEPYSVIFEEVKTSKNRDGGPQVRYYEMVFDQNKIYFDFYLRLYEDVTRAINGEMVYVPNIHTLFDNEISLVAYIHYLDVEQKKEQLMKQRKAETMTELLKKQMQTVGNMQSLQKLMDTKFVSAKNFNYERMQNHEKIQTKLMEHGMMLQHHKTVEGAAVDMYQYQPSIGLKMSRLRNYIADVELVLGKSGVRILAPIPNTSLVGFEVPRDERRFPAMPVPTGDFNIAIGQTVMGDTRYFDIRTAPHMLVAGATGSGKSVFLTGLIEQLLAIPNAKIHLFDPKMVEMAFYENRVQEYKTDHDDIVLSLMEIVEDMNLRYENIKTRGARNIAETDIPYRFVVIDEFGDLIQNKDLQTTMLLLAQKARAAGIHLIIATQRPSVDVISGTIKANFPTKAVFRTAKAIDSRVVLDGDGAEKLTGKGDMLFASDEGVERLQGFNV